MPRLHLTHIAYRSGVITLTDDQLANVVSMALNAYRTGRSFAEALAEGDFPAELQRATSKENDLPDNAWLIQNLHALVEGNARPDVVIENEFHRALFDDAWAIQTAMNDEYDSASEVTDTIDSLVREMERTIRGPEFGGSLSRLIAYFDEYYERFRTEHSLLALSSSIELEVRFWLSVWISENEIRESDFRRVVELLQEQENYLYILDDVEKLAENLLHNALINAQTNQFFDSVLYIHRTLIHAEREGLPYWQCRALLLKVQIDEAVSNHALAEEAREEIRGLLSQNAGEPWVETIRGMV